MKEYYHNKYAEMERDHWWGRGRKRILTMLIEEGLRGWISPTPRVIVDIGCGVGSFLNVLGRFGNAWGLESFEESARYCWEHNSHRIVMGQSLSLPFRTSQLDVVTMFDVLEHIEKDDKMLEEVWRVLKPGGQYIIAVPAHQWMWGNQDIISEHKRRYSFKGLKQLLEGQGFKIERATYFNTFLFAPIALIRLFRRWFPPSLGSDGKIRSDFGDAPPHPIVNEPMAIFSGGEVYPLRVMDLPFGVSLFFRAIKPV